MATKASAHPSLGRLFCRLVTFAFALLYVVALLFQALSAVGLFGVPAPLAGVFLVVLGLPWTLGAAWFADPVQPLAAALAPAVSLLILAVLCSLPPRRYSNATGFAKERRRR